MIYLHKHSIKLAILQTIVCLAQLSSAFPLEQASSHHNSPQSTTTAEERKHQRHKKIARAAALGVLTGGLFGVVLGGSILAHAIVGAGTHAGIASIKEHRAAKKQHQHDAQAAHTTPANKQKKSSEKALIPNH